MSNTKNPTFSLTFSLSILFRMWEYYAFKLYFPLMSRRCAMPYFSTPTSSLVAYLELCRNKLAPIDHSLNPSAFVRVARACTQVLHASAFQSTACLSSPNNIQFTLQARRDWNQENDGKCLSLLKYELKYYLTSIQCHDASSLRKFTPHS